MRPYDSTHFTYRSILCHSLIYVSPYCDVNNMRTITYDRTVTLFNALFSALHERSYIYISLFSTWIHSTTCEWNPGWMINDRAIVIFSDLSSNFPKKYKNFFLQNFDVKKVIFNDHPNASIAWKWNNNHLYTAHHTTSPIIQHREASVMSIAYIWKDKRRTHRKTTFLNWIQCFVPQFVESIGSGKMVYRIYAFDDIAYTSALSRSLHHKCAVVVVNWNETAPAQQFVKKTQSIKLELLFSLSFSPSQNDCEALKQIGKYWFIAQKWDKIGHVDRSRRPFNEKQEISSTDISAYSIVSKVSHRRHHAKFAVELTMKKCIVRLVCKPLLGFWWMKVAKIKNKKIEEKEEANKPPDNKSTFEKWTEK